MDEREGPISVIRLILLGCGGVGRQLLHHIVSTRALHRSQGVRVALLAVIDSQFIVSKPEEEFDDSTILELCSAKEAKKAISTIDGVMAEPLGSSSILTICAAIEGIGAGFPLVVADCTASEEIGLALAGISTLNCCIVLANKKPLTSSLEIFNRISALRRRFRCESTVGAGLPVIASINRLLNSGDPIKRIVGALSGTLGYVMSQLEEKKQFSEIVKSAKALGYTEPDPRDDLSGMDVARKALIMARLMGWKLHLDDVKVDCLYPSDLAPKAMSVERFLHEGLPALDIAMRDRVEAAAEKGCVLRYVATIENFQCKVGLVEQPRQSALGQLQGSDNLIEIYTRCYSDSPLVIKGAGAGNDTTAAGVLADIIDLQEFF